MRTRVKICGITRPEDARLAAELGVDAIGLVFHPSSPRAVSVARAADIVAVLPPFVSVVALFVDPSEGVVREVLRTVPVDLLQFHGDEEPAFCRMFGCPYIKAIAMRRGLDLAAAVERYPEASGVLLDSYREGVAGGTGMAFDWTLVPGRLGKPVVLAGGLTAENVFAAIRTVRPYAVDVSSGVEAAKGVKDPDRMHAFIQEVERASKSP
jgi:phosphoribosylanthranilate isomerase